MLHLIPHVSTQFSKIERPSNTCLTKFGFQAFAEHHDEADDNTQHNHASVYKGLGALAGIYVFFLIEKLMKMRHQRTQEKNYIKVRQIGSSK